jgi:phosphonatase-like hydrolase
MRQAKLVVMDLAGTTIVDSGDVASSLCKAFALRGFEVPHDWANALMGIPKTVAISDLLVRLGVDGRSVGFMPLVNEIHDLFVADMIDHYSVTAPAAVIDGVEDVISRMYAAGLIVYFDTGFDRTIANEIVRQVGWTSRAWYRGVITSSDVDNGRPFPDMIYEIMRRCSVRYPDSVVKIGDTPSDIQQGERAGCGMVIGVTYGTHGEEALRLAGATAIANTPDEILGHLGLDGDF